MLERKREREKEERIRMRIMNQSSILLLLFTNLLVHGPYYSVIDAYTATTTTSTATTTSVHLFSLRWPKEFKNNNNNNYYYNNNNNDNDNDDNIVFFSKPLMDVWRWKDSVLGDGRDFFVPKPKTLSALNRYIIEQSLFLSSSSSFSIQECCVISNCARFEIIIVLDDYVNDDYISLKRLISECIAAQVMAHQNRNNNNNNNNNNSPLLFLDIIQDQFSALDRPSLIQNDALVQFYSNQNYDDNGDNHDNHTQESASASASASASSSHNENLLLLSELIEHGWRHTIDNTNNINNSNNDINININDNDNNTNIPKKKDTVESVCRHLCMVAAGMAPRPNRPERDVPFRPFSSRDAHILLQLKRTSEVAAKAIKTTTSETKTGSTSTSTSTSYIKLLFDTALTAGKAVRDIQKVPSLAKLTQYGSSSSSSSSSSDMVLMKQVRDDAIATAIEPAIRSCLDKFRARKQSQNIQRLRIQAEGLAENERETKWIKRRIHGPTMELRKSESESESESESDIDIDQLLDSLRMELSNMREEGRRQLIISKQSNLTSS